MAVSYSKGIKISIHALLAESDDRLGRADETKRISIHALLAESDYMGVTVLGIQHNFYPRSPCGERRSRDSSMLFAVLFLSTLSLRRATGFWQYTSMALLFLSTLSLRRATQPLKPLSSTPRFLSTLSLRRATGQSSCPSACPHISIHALLAESDRIMLYIYEGLDISIHALLAESDLPCCCLLLPVLRFLSTLSLRRATKGNCEPVSRQTHFYPRSPCGERHYFCLPVLFDFYFYPRSPCGERRRRSVKLFRQNYISIHALLAESDSW